MTYPVTGQHLPPNHQAIQAHELSSCPGLNHSSHQQATMVLHRSNTLATMVDYASRLEASIKHAQSSVRQLSTALGISYQAIKKVLDGKSTALNAENHVRAARMLGVSSFWLATGEGQMVDTKPAPPPISIQQYKVSEGGLVDQNYAWPFKSVSANSLKQLPERQLGQIEGYINRILDEEIKSESNGTNHNKSHS